MPTLDEMARKPKKRSLDDMAATPKRKKSAPLPAWAAAVAKQDEEIASQRKAEEARKKKAPRAVREFAEAVVPGMQMAQNSWAGNPYMPPVIPRPVRKSTDAETAQAIGGIESLVENATMGIVRPDWGGDPTARQLTTLGVLPATMVGGGGIAKGAAALGSKLPVIGNIIRGAQGASQAANALPLAGRLGVGALEGIGANALFTAPGGLIHGDFVEQNTDPLNLIIASVLGGGAKALGGVKKPISAKTSATGETGAPFTEWDWLNRKRQEAGVRPLDINKAPDQQMMGAWLRSQPEVAAQSPFNYKRAVPGKEPVPQKALPAPKDAPLGKAPRDTTVDSIVRRIDKLQASLGEGADASKVAPRIRQAETALTKKVQALTRERDALEARGLNPDRVQEIDAVIANLPPEYRPATKVPALQKEPAYMGPSRPIETPKPAVISDPVDAAIKSSGLSRADLNNPTNQALLAQSLDIPGTIDEKIALVKNRMTKRASKLGTGPDPALLYDGAELGYLYLKKGAQSFDTWTRQMVETLGEEIRPYLNNIWQKLNEGGDIDSAFSRIAKNPAVLTQAAEQAPQATASAPIIPAPTETPVGRLVSAIKKAPNVRNQQEALYSQERAKRAAMVRSSLNTGTGEGAFIRAKGAMKGELPKVAFEAPKKIIDPDDINQYYEQIRTTTAFPERNVFDKISTFEALNKVLAGEVPQREQIVKLERVFGPELAEAILAKRGTWEKFKENFWDVANIPRTFKTMLDFSAMLRQGGMLAVGENRAWMRAIKPMLKATVSEKAYIQIDDAIKSNPYYTKLEDAGLYLAPVEQSAMLSSREEAFVSRLLHKVPVFKQAVGMSERSYNTFLNSLRSDVFYKYAGLWGDDATAKDYAELAKFINNATGRGNLGSAEAASHILSSVFFSPRWFMSRIQAPLSLASSSPKARAVAAKNLVAFTATALSTLELMKLAGASVETNPTSSDFGKARFGNTRIDLFAGYQQIVRYVAQLISGKRKDTETGGAQKLNRWNDVAIRFGESKLAPAPGTVVSALKGRTYSGQEFAFDREHVGSLLYEGLTPLAVQDIADAVQLQGPIAGMLVAPAAIMGVGASTYEPRKRGRSSTGGYTSEFTTNYGGF